MRSTGISTRRPPDVVIVGAPKCGTTSLYSYLSGHPGVFASPIKEPNFFCLDTPGLRVVNRWSDYEGLFRAARADQLRLEASTAYLLSPVAVPAILEANPRAKIIAAVRDPIEMIVSYHAQKLYAFEEDQADFELAWELSEHRARGERVNARCRAPAYLDYKSVARLGGQVTRMVRLVPPDQLLVVLFDNLSRDAESVYGVVLDFLGLAPDGRKDFRVANARKTHAWPALSRLIVRPPRLLQSSKRLARRAFPQFSKSAGRLVHGLLQRPTPRTAIAPDLRRRLANELRPDVEKLARLLNRDLAGWTRCD
ncbi:MAG TPA: sulfotransferase [Geminicoccaceae bacterium]|nr:sulfotransferase [Geminicoccaceae bacterium]